MSLELVYTIIYVALGSVFLQAFAALWYSKNLFGKKWSSLVKVNKVPEAVKNRNYLITFITGSIVSLFVFFLINSSPGIGFFDAGVSVLFLFVLFAAFLSIPNFLYEQRNLKLMAMYYGYASVSLFLLAGIYSLVLL